MSPLLTLSGDESADKPILAAEYAKLYTSGTTYTFDGKPVSILNFPSNVWTGHPYFLQHLCTRENAIKGTGRPYCKDRSERMLWSRDLLLNYKAAGVLLWKANYKVKFRRAFVYASECRYVLVLEDNNFNPNPKLRADKYTFVSAHIVTDETEHRKLMASYSEKKIPVWKPV
ncbi:hypothetical protein ACLWBD_00500 [Bdellovibrio sp. HCB117]|uniref:hypothetical protein n=1 Tax=Bdellovibrio sp. HCB117 TaxID=3394359 RepID=UPI0039B62BF3